MTQGMVSCNRAEMYVARSAAVIRRNLEQKASLLTTEQYID